MCEVISFKSLLGTTGILATQELRAALAICTGMANKEIARELNCSPATIKKSVERIFFKLGVSNRAALVARAFAMGLISFSGGMIPTPQRQDQDQHAGILIA